MNDEGETTPEPEYDGGNALVSVTLTHDQVALIIFCLMEQSKQVTLQEQLRWTRLALGLNDLVVEAENGGAESG